MNVAFFCFKRRIAVDDNASWVHTEVVVCQPADGQTCIATEGQVLSCRTGHEKLSMDVTCNDFGVCVCKMLHIYIHKNTQICVLNVNTWTLLKISQRNKFRWTPLELFLTIPVYDETFAKCTGFVLFSPFALFFLITPLLFAEIIIIVNYTIQVLLLFRHELIFFPLWAQNIPASEHKDSLK